MLEEKKNSAFLQLSVDKEHKSWLEIAIDNFESDVSKFSLF